MSRPTFWQSVRELPLGLTIVFCLGVRALFFHLYGLTYDASTPWWQMLDVELLRAAPIRSIYLMHMQPPLLNLLYAAALALPGESGFIVLHLIFVGSSLVMVVMLYVLLRRFGFRPRGAGVAAALFGVLPQVLLYESIYFYSQLEAVLVVAAAALAMAYFEHRRLAAFIGFAACLVVLGWLRSLFHLGWVTGVLFVACVLVSRQPGWDRRIVAVAVAAVLVVASLYLKNLKEFGIFSASSWDGASLMNMVLPARAGDEAKFPSVIEDVRRRIDLGELSPSTAAALQAPNIWYGWAGSANDCGRQDESHRAVCAVRRSDGTLNLNHLAMIDYSRNLGRDAWRLLVLYPAVYLDHAGSSLLTFLGTPSWDYLSLPFKLEAYTDAWNHVLLYESVRDLRANGARSTGWWASVRNRLATSSLPLIVVVIVGSVFIVLAGVRDAVGYWRGTQATADWVFPALVIALFGLVPNLINGFEAQRIRYSVEPLIYLGFLAGSLRLTESWRFRRQA